MASEIGQIRNYKTGELDSPHRIGETEDGRPLYQFIEGWEPVDSDGNEVECECDEDGNWIPVDEHGEKVVAAARKDAGLFVGEFGEPLNSAKTDWDATAWADVVRELRLEPKQAEALWPVYSTVLERETFRQAQEG